MTGLFDGQMREHAVSGHERQRDDRADAAT
jgi:hypothetical protein